MFLDKFFYDADGTEAGGGSVSASAGSAISTAAATGNDTGSTTSAAGIENAAAVTHDAGQGEGSKEIVSGGVKLVIDPNGKRRVVTVAAEAQSQAEVDAKTPAATTGVTALQPVVAPQQNGTVLPEMVQPQAQITDNNNAAAGIISDVLVNANGGEAAYSSEELLLAIQLNQVDERRIPEAYRSQYAAFKASSEDKAQSTQSDVSKNSDVAAAEFYTKVNGLARQMAMQELGITEDDIAAAEYADDKLLKDKVDNFNAAVDFNRNKIFADVQMQRAKSVEEAERAKFEHDSIYNEIKNYTLQVQQSEPNFKAIDVLMETRYMNLPYEQAKTIEPVLMALKNHTIKREQLPILQKYYDDTRLEYYAKLNGAGRIPTPVAKPPVLETPGTGSDMPDVKADFSKLRNMNRREKQAYLSQYLGKRTK